MEFFQTSSWVAALAEVREMALQKLVLLLMVLASLLKRFLLLGSLIIISIIIIISLLSYHADLPALLLSYSPILLLS